MKTFPAILFIFLGLIISDTVFANTNFDVKRIKEWNKPVNQLQLNNNKQFTKEKNKKEQSKSNKTKKSTSLNKPLTNYQYDDVHYKYNRIKNYTQDNINYSQSGQAVKFN